MVNVPRQYPSGGQTSVTPGWAAGTTGATTAVTPDAAGGMLVGRTPVVAAAAAVGGAPVGCSSTLPLPWQSGHSLWPAGGGDSQKLAHWHDERKCEIDQNRCRTTINLYSKIQVVVSNLLLSIFGDYQFCIFQ